MSLPRRARRVKARNGLRPRAPPGRGSGSDGGLAHPVRIRILETLRSGELSVQELPAALGLDQAAVSQQLAVLRARSMVSARKEGTTVRYAVRDALVGDLLDVARRIFNNQLAGTQRMLHQLRRETRRAREC